MGGPLHKRKNGLPPNIWAGDRDFVVKPVLIPGMYPPQLYGTPQPVSGCLSFPKGVFLGQSRSRVLGIFATNLGEIEAECNAVLSTGRQR